MDFWAKYIAELPRVAATLTTTLVIFLVSLLFAPVRDLLFPSTIEGYPLICTAEPTPAPGGMRVEFFIINRTGEPFTRAKLDDFLTQNKADSTSSPHSDIHLKMNANGSISKAIADDEFNRSKGTLRVVHDERSVTIAIDNIEARAVLRTYIEFAGLSFPDASITRNAKSSVPLVFKDYQDACYSR